MKNQYENPLTTRYASAEMSRIFSPDNKFITWRKLWIALAKGEQALGLPIDDAQIDEMIAQIDNIDYALVAEKERALRHDVMAHVHAYGVACPKAKGIIHLGATSAYVGDNTDIIVYREGLILVRKRLLNLIARLKRFALRYKDLPTLGFTHFQPAQLTTVGKRATLWIQDLMIDLNDLNYLIEGIQFLGVKGTTGTQASFMDLFDDDEEKVQKLETYVAKEMGFDKCYGVSGQTYPRKFDSRVMNVLSGIAQSLSKFAHDIRLLQHLKEIEEPFEKSQIGSSAMAYKRNPMRSERISSLARHIIVNTLNPAMTAATQWFERTLDDSANKRIALSEGFLATDAILLIATNVASGMVVYPEVIEQRIMAELPFMATENIIMEGVKNGGDRQELHEKIRILSMEAGRVVKEEGKPNDLMQRIIADGSFGIQEADSALLLDPEKYIGRAPQQVEEYLSNEVQPILEAFKEEINTKEIELTV